MNCIVCAIAKLENAYLYEWAKYHLALGFSAIHVFDNNDEDGERILDVFRGTECESQVIVHDVRGQRYVQKKVYQECYDNEDFDWCAFIDIDEFITFTEASGIKTINDFLKDKNDWEAVHLNWMCYGDGGEVKYSDRPVVERFKKEWKKDVYYTYLDKNENGHIKSLIKKGLCISWMLDNENHPSNPHTPWGLSKVCDASGCAKSNMVFSEVDYSVAYIRHYITKSIEEYSRKINRQCADVSNITYYNIPKFFRVNKPTLRKLFWVSRNVPEVKLEDCIIEHLKFFSHNYYLPFFDS